MAKKNEIVTLYGNLGGDPKVHQIPETTGTRPAYDPMIDDVVEKPFTRKAREFRTFSIAVRTKEMEEPRWIHCIEWTDSSKLFRKGDRVRLTGFFQIRDYEKDGEPQRIKQFVVRSAAIEHAKLRQTAD